MIGREKEQRGNRGYGQRNSKKPKKLQLGIYQPSR